MEIKIYSSPIEWELIETLESFNLVGLLSDVILIILW